MEAEGRDVKNTKGKSAWKRRIIRTANIWGLSMPILSDLQVISSFKVKFKFISSPRTCEVDIIYFTGEEMEAQRGNLPKLVMVEAAHLA